MKLFHLVSLGCAKNLVDSEVILGSMVASGWQFSEDPEDADVLIVNTCGFIQAAVEEAIGEIFTMVRIKAKYPDKQLVVVGCMVQRYKDKLAEELPEVDLFVGTEGAGEIALFISRLGDGQCQPRVITPPRSLMTSRTPRLLSTPSFRAWMKITEGCDNRCSYCMIPMIRGGLRSRPIDDLLVEAKKLDNLGVKELSLIAQDSTAYGRDLGTSPRLETLVKELLSQTSIPWLRLLYLYPTGISDELLALMADNSRVVPYLDIPLQHVSNPILRAMNRRYNADIVSENIEKIRSRIPNIALRTTFLVGFPGESDKDFLEIESFLRTMRIDHVGVFSYANEEGAPAEKLAGQVPTKVKNQRRKHLLEVQAEISADIQKKYIGTTENVLVEGFSKETDLLLQGRTRFQAPEVDGCVLINEGVASPGDIVPVLITESQVYDLLGGIVQD